MITKCQECGRTLTSLEEVENAVCTQCFKDFVFDEDDYRELDFHDRWEDNKMMEY